MTTKFIVILLSISWLIGMMVVRIKHNHSPITVFIPGCNFYTRTQISRRGSLLSIVTSATSFILGLVIGFLGYQFIQQQPCETLGCLPIILRFLQSNVYLIIPWLILQLWVNRGVAHQYNKGLRSGVELTFLPFFFWMILALTHKHTLYEEDTD